MTGSFSNVSVTDNQAEKVGLKPWKCLREMFSSYSSELDAMRHGLKLTVPNRHKEGRMPVD